MIGVRMLKLIALLLNLLILASQASAECSTNQCQSLNNPDNCLEIDDVEEMDCKTYTCLYRSNLGRGVLVLDPNQEIRCQINGECYGVGTGPNLCAFCALDDNGGVTPIPGCKVGDTCHPVGSVYDDGCTIRQCTVEHSAVSMSLKGTTGCTYKNDGNCYGLGETLYDNTCNECKRNTDTSYHEWYRECRDVGQQMCFVKGSVHSIFCNTLICDNRNGIGWHRHSGSSCAVSEYDCIQYNATSPRDGYCYACDSPSGGDPVVTCLSDCGDCVRLGQSVQCNGQTFTCGSVVDPPSEDEIECDLNGQILKVGDTGSDECNLYECTIYGLQLCSTRCSHQGQCYDAGDVIDEENCLRCYSDGQSVNVEQGCKYDNQCYSQGMNIRDNCQNKVCTKIGNTYRFTKTDFQPTPCKCYDKCYPRGEFVYGNNQLCAECFENGTVAYACRLSDGSCLPAGETEAAPSSGCYKMQCEYTAATRTYKLSKAPGQPQRCLLPDGSCLEEGQTSVVDGKSYGCHVGVCSFMNTTIAVGGTYDMYCHTFGCMETTVGTRKVLSTFVQSYGCQLGESCIALGDEYEKDCNTYQCKRKEGVVLAQNVRVTERCSCFGTCMDIGAHIWTQYCNKRECMADLTTKVVEKGCVSQLYGNCLRINQTTTKDGVTEVCKDQSETTEDTEGTDGNTNTDSGNGGQDGLQDHVCTWGSLSVPFGTNATQYCTNVVCEQRGNAVGLFVVGSPRCKMTVNNQETCFDVGTSQFCTACKLNTENGFAYPEREGCMTNNGSCVDYNEEIDYNCGRYKCDPTSSQMTKVSKDKCSVRGECYDDTNPKILIDGSVTRMCVCVNPDTNQLSCTLAS